MKFYFSFNISFVFFLPGRRTACLVCPELRTWVFWVCIPVFPELERQAEGSTVQNHPQLHSKFQPGIHKTMAQKQVPAWTHKTLPQKHSTVFLPNLCSQDFQRLTTVFFPHNHTPQLFFQIIDSLNSFLSFLSEEHISRLNIKHRHLCSSVIINSIWLLFMRQLF